MYISVIECDGKRFQLPEDFDLFLPAKCASSILDNFLVVDIGGNKATVKIVVEHLVVEFLTSDRERKSIGDFPIVLIKPIALLTKAVTPLQQVYNRHRR